MKIRQTCINLIYPQLTDYRKKFVDFEGQLRDQFMPAAILPVPDEADPSIPRINVQSLHGHSVLNIALNASSLVTNYDNEYVNDWFLCADYLKERCKKVFQIINDLTNNNIFYTGLIINLEYDDINGDSLQLMKNSFLKNKGSNLGNLNDFGCKFTYVKDDTYFINITLNHVVNYQVKNCNNGKQVIKDEENNFIGVTLDINDRFSANKIEEYRSDEKSFGKLLDISTEVINHRLNHFIEEGKLDL